MGILPTVALAAATAAAVTTPLVYLATVLAIRHQRKNEPEHNGLKDIHLTEEEAEVLYEQLEHYFACPGRRERRIWAELEELDDDEPLT